MKRLFEIFKNEYTQRAVKNFFGYSIPLIASLLIEVCLNYFEGKCEEKFYVLGLLANTLLLGVIGVFLYSLILYNIQINKKTDSTKSKAYVALGVVSVIIFFLALIAFFLIRFHLMGYGNPKAVFDIPLVILIWVACVICSAMCQAIKVGE